MVDVVIELAMEWKAAVVINGMKVNFLESRGSAIMISMITVGLCGICVRKVEADSVV